MKNGTTGCDWDVVPFIVAFDPFQLLYHTVSGFVESPLRGTLDVSTKG